MKISLFPRLFLMFVLEKAEKNLSFIWVISKKSSLYLVNKLCCLSGRAASTLSIPILLSSRLDPTP